MVGSYKTIVTLVKKDILLELRQQFSLYGVLLYVATTTYMCFLALGQPDTTVWNGLFWVTQLFVCVNAVAKSFLQENSGRMLYFYAIAGPRDFILAKLLFNLLLMLVMSSISLLLFTILLGNPLVKMANFICISILGGLSLSLVFTFLAAIAAKAKQSAALMAILGFPVIVPQLLLLIKLSNAGLGMVQESWGMLAIVLLALDFMVVLLAVILFPFLWKD
jgi:heme exporter protein B